MTGTKRVSMAFTVNDGKKSERAMGIDLPHKNNESSFFIIDSSFKMTKMENNRKRFNVSFGSCLMGLWTLMGNPFCHKSMLSQIQQKGKAIKLSFTSRGFCFYPWDKCKQPTHAIVKVQILNLIIKFLHHAMSVWLISSHCN
ncbi:CLUMA_CG009805, isoform A [Clunio marinus]|uniref:CLUMA_CG009805, isoform A n=1 Tax=Clunio marinus TaxID=568069 RepID=A0A1J1I9Z1_9DIPT|nr:CLUMA_CG009805, isoform A [Clunio marinus]